MESFESITVNGIAKPITNSLGEPIAPTEEGIRNFWNWFGDSKMVDGEGRPLVCYHGTDVDFDYFDHYVTYDKVTWFAFDRNYITNQESGASGTNIVLPLYVRITNPAGWDEQDQYFADQLITAGYDGVILPDNENTTGYVWDEKNIKIADGSNTTFDNSKFFRK